jgi:hypothetical protein
MSTTERTPKPHGRKRQVPDQGATATGPWGRAGSSGMLRPRSESREKLRSR